MTVARAGLMLAAAMLLPLAGARAQGAPPARGAVRVSATVVRVEASQAGARLAREVALATPRERTAVRRDGVAMVKVARAERGERRVTIEML